MILYDYWRSSAAYRVRIALNLKGIAYQREAVDISQGAQRTPDFRARNPQGLVPALDIGSGVLTQSLAIIDYLDAMHPAVPLLSRDPLARATALAQALVIVADLHPIDNLRVLDRLTAQFGADQTAREDWYRHWMIEGLTALEAMTADLPGPFLGGDAPNLVDVCLVPQLYNARRFAVPLDAWPRLVAADAAASALPAIAAAHPDRVRPEPPYHVGPPLDSIEPLTEKVTGRVSAFFVLIEFPVFDRPRIRASLSINPEEDVLSHTTIGVADMRAARDFYDPLFKQLGLVLKFADETWAGWKHPDAARPLFIITRPFDNEPASPGNGQMVALLAATRSTVDACHALALLHGGSDEGMPNVRPQYHAAYYGAYFRDPDGNKLCVCCHDSGS